MSQHRILLIEDDADIREGVRILLESENYLVTEAESGEQGLAAMDDSIDLVILDIIMPGMNGLKTCEEIRKVSNVPILFLTAKATESDKLIGLMVGGDDYLPKPFSYAELLARVKSLIRRYNIYRGRNEAQAVDDSWLELSGIRINTAYNEVYANGKKINLPNIEYKMLLLMMEHSGKIFSAQNLYESIWDEPYFYNSNNTVMVHIRSLRIKIEENAQEPRHIKTVWGKGYKFE